MANRPGSYSCSYGLQLLSLESRRRLETAPEEVRQSPEHTGAHGPQPRVRAIAHRDVSRDRKHDVEGESTIGPFLEPRRHRREQHDDAEQFGPCKLHAEVIGEAEVRECFRHLRQSQLRVGSETYLQTEDRSDDPEADDHSLRAVHVRSSTLNCFAYSACNRCQPLNLMVSGPTIRPIGSPASNRSRMSKQMCQPAAPHEM